jgi:hypothetical protein
MEEKATSGQDQPRILSPNLGCPLLVTAEELAAGIGPLILACKPGQTIWGKYRIVAAPSFASDDVLPEFDLELGDPQRLEDDTLPAYFEDVSETRFLISTHLRAKVFPGSQFWSFRVRPVLPKHGKLLRVVAGKQRATLYDLNLFHDDKAVGKVKHAICVHSPLSRIQFVHLTDLHLAERNDIWQEEWDTALSIRQDASRPRLINFNKRLRTFIEWANTRADRGELDFVLVLGDLVDFAAQGLGDRPTEDSNWRFAEQMFTGSFQESGRGNDGLRVPIFTSTGNHDWRISPYPADASSRIRDDITIFGVSQKAARRLDFLYHDTSEAIGKRIEEVDSKLVKEGSPILVRRWWGSILGPGIKWIQLALEHVSTRIWAVGGKLLKSRNLTAALGTAVVAYLGRHFPWAVGKLSSDGLWAALNTLFGHDAKEPYPGFLALLKSSLPTLEAVGGLLLLYAILMPKLRNYVGQKLRGAIMGLIAIETSVDALHDYFLLFNPYFNYAFRAGDCNFMVMDTGHDCLTGQSFWDEGGKKLSRVTVRDNIMGGSPDSMAFYPPNENYPYSQIRWLELALECVGRTHKQIACAPRNCRIIVGLHAPAGNLSHKERAKAAKLRQASEGKPILLKKQTWFSGFNVHYGCINHFLSQFYYMALGSRESDPHRAAGPGVDIVLAGHTHCNLEFQLRKPQAAQPAGKWDPEIYYGHFSPEVVANPNQLKDAWWPLLLQTAACGPPSSTDQESPNFRYITVEADLRVSALVPLKWVLSGPVDGEIH